MLTLQTCNHFYANVYMLLLLMFASILFLLSVLIYIWVCLIKDLNKSWEVCLCFWFKWLCGLCFLFL